MSTEHDDAIRAAYEAFWQKRAEVKKRHKQELEDETAKERQTLAQVMWAARRSPDKYSVLDIAGVLGITNKNFLYSVLNDKPINDPATKPVGRPSSAEKSPKPDKEKSAPFHLKLQDVGPRPDGVWYVRIENLSDGTYKEYVFKVDSDGRIIDIPEDWFVDTLTPDEVEFYRNLIHRIESGE